MATEVPQAMAVPRATAVVLAMEVRGHLHPRKVGLVQRSRHLCYPLRPAHPQRCQVTPDSCLVIRGAEACHFQAREVILGQILTLEQERALAQTHTREVLLIPIPPLAPALGLTLTPPVIQPLILPVIQPLTRAL